MLGGERQQMFRCHENRWFSMYLCIKLKKKKGIARAIITTLLVEISFKGGIWMSCMWNKKICYWKPDKPPRETPSSEVLTEHSWSYKTFGGYLFWYIYIFMYVIGFGILKSSPNIWLCNTVPGEVQLSQRQPVLKSNSSFSWVMNCDSRERLAEVKQLLPDCHITLSGIFQY